MDYGISPLQNLFSFICSFIVFCFVLFKFSHFGSFIIGFLKILSKANVWFSFNNSG